MFLQRRLIVLFIVLGWKVAVLLAARKKVSRPCERNFYTVQRPRSTLVKVDLKLEETTIIGQLIGGEGGTVNSLEYDFYAGSRTFAMIEREGESFLALVDLHTASTIEIGATLVPDMRGLALDGNEALYSHSQRDKTLYKLDQVTGRATAVFETNVNGVVDMAYRPSDGLIYATNMSHLFSFNISSHKVSTLGMFRDKQRVKMRVLGIIFNRKNALFGIRGSGTRSIHKFNLGNLVTESTKASNLRGTTFGATIRCNIFRKPSWCSPNTKTNYQPKVTIFEGPPASPARQSWNSLTRASSPWCQGMPTIWGVGHQPYNETPWCKQNDGIWIQPSIAVLDVTDELNAADGSGGIDRHSCTHMDVDEDGEPDIMCVVGANRGQGLGYSELYLTQSDGTLQKVMHHGLQSHPTLRGRFILRLKGADGSKLILLVSNGAKRDDGGRNVHTMYKVIPDFPYFVEIEDGPWQKNIKPPCAVAADWNGDGIEDFILCNKKGPAVLMQQKPTGDWASVNLPNSNDALIEWTNVRVGDVTGDGRPDLVVVKGSLLEPSTLFIFSGRRLPPYFKFDSPYFELDFEHRAVDVELLDVNKDGHFDIYVVLRNQVDPGQYCGTDDPSIYWREKAGPRGRFPPEDWAPPVDKIPDLLLLNGLGLGEPSFEVVKMQGCYPGCGSRAERYGNNKTMILSHEDPNLPGFGLLLEW